MRLTKIKLAGFKSFVDPTTVQLPGNLAGVVGPNGCGKSNVIDAVRWVMGETSAKHLRGDSMADVIFSGSNTRKPVGHASIELVFDNSDGSVGGQYASYNEISVKRQVSRDGTSTYFLNSTRCRRRDITDIFLGTGLGPRSYSIIEQGMISRLIEAKPEELRVYLEEAAGISKYKERRRETENRIRHTRENLERLDDLREEVEKHLQHLQRQARTAEKYKELKEEERRAKGELLALRLSALDKEAGEQEYQIKEQETELERVVAGQRAVESKLEKEREAHVEATDAFNEVQARYYGVGGEIARVEQSIQHGKEMRQKHEQDLEQVKEGWRELEQHIDSDRTRLDELVRELESAIPSLEQARATEQASNEALNEAEGRMQQWQQEWDELTRRGAAHSEAVQVERTRIDHLERHITQSRQRLERIEEEDRSLVESDAANELERLERQETEQVNEGERLQQELDSVLGRIAEVRERNRELRGALDDHQGAAQDVRGRLASLEALQQAALGQTDGGITQWLEQRGLADAPRLAQELKVEPGWERAVETVLGFHLEAVCVEGLDAVASALGSLDQGALSVFDTSARVHIPAADEPPGVALADRVEAPWSTGDVLAGIYCADDLNQALALRARLKAHESLITPEGIWIGNTWLRVARDSDERAGVLGREQEIQALRERLEELSNAIASSEQELEHGQEQLAELEERRESTQAQVNDAHRALSELRAEIATRRSQQEQTEARLAQIRAEAQELREEIERDQDSMREAQDRLNTALEQTGMLNAEKESLAGRREELNEALDAAREQARGDRDQAHELALRVETLRSQEESTRQNLQRMEQQLEGLRQRHQELEQALSGGEQPLHEQEQQLAQLLEQRVAVENELSEARAKVEAIDEALRGHESERTEAEEQVQKVRETLEQLRLAWREISVRRETVQEQLAETELSQRELLENLPAEANEEEWQQKVEKLGNRISRLGPINLAAIDEFAEQSERKKYLDAQHEDVSEALATLENAIRKIDRETRTRFKETYDQVNQGLKDLFPRLFGGGHAYLELTGEDLLDTGVTVMARPPGKRNSSIHLLSGGEKALTAVALVFSLFQLNPAPFCLLDEVDAPLDDANVSRFCDLVREMSEQVQFIFITHNKLTMSMADQLVGVTMNEPGVSRLVAVDVDEAARMAAV